MNVIYMYRVSVTLSLSVYICICIYVLIYICIDFFMAEHSALCKRKAVLQVEQKENVLQVCQ